MQLESHPNPKVASLFAIILVVLLGLGAYWFVYQKNLSTPPVVVVTVTPSPAVSSLSGAVYYSQNSSVFAYNPATKISVKIDTGFGVGISHDKNRLAYLKSMNSDDTVNSLNVLDIATNKITTVYTVNSPSGFVAWSPDDSYLIIDEGTSPIRNEQIITVGGKEVGNIGNNPLWINNTQVAFNQQSGIPEQDVEGDVTNIVVFDAITGKTFIVQKASTVTSYNVTTVSATAIYFIKSTVATPADWSVASKSVDTFWSIDPSGNNLSSESAAMVSDQDLLDAKIYKALPSSYQAVDAVYGNIPLNMVYQSSENISTGEAVFLVHGPIYIELDAINFNQANSLIVIQKNTVDGGGVSNVAWAGSN